MLYNFIAIEGNIGAGKTTLAKMLSAELNTKLILEQFEDNSFLPKFYKEPEKYAFPLELSFLAERFQQLRTQLIQKELFTNGIISDYFISKSLIFARKTLQDDLFGLYSNLFDIIGDSLPKPDLLVYLYLPISRLKENIKHRGRDYEQNIDPHYLEKIQEGYFEYLRRQENMRILIIDTNELDFVHHQNDYELLKKIIFREYHIGIHRITPEELSSF
ncbi:MAG: deoxynucleoside kinase [Bacteroidales bacterium]|nr:deoxynucleoside kinase [Bacteroidales bacterium]